MLAPHVVRTLDFAAEGRAPENELLVPDLKQVGQIGVPAGKLGELHRPAVLRQMSADPRLEPPEIELLARAHFLGGVDRRSAHDFTVKPY
jgi:hypothetical protein